MWSNFHLFLNLLSFDFINDYLCSSVVPKIQVTY
jgi:hypothetical protein